ncbi:MULTISPECIES: sporulation YhaL family protein [Bacillaceae]|uniref:Sporulation YhaL family protein n=2 Tax=Metabacillus TaxID=2675233 RepID=A0ABS5LBY9_9BACI|nr:MULTISPECIES: sporulation YhaL family protein [Bacillaceae]KZZ84669.1 SigE-dependent sporulation protein [Bacillus sp. SJS]MBS2968247.1 sporulation YhaL family protein [Metabacillus flavus]
MLTLPWWIYLCMGGVLFSGFKFVTLTREDIRTDEEFIEQEGQIYLERIKAERERRKAEKMTV